MSLFTQVKEFFVGRPLKTEAQSEERLPNFKALAILSADAISSVAYATQGILAELSSVSLNWVIPLSLVIIILAWCVTLAYRSVIKAYPGGGGSYTIALDQFNPTVALIAAGALIIDYILTVAVSVTSGVAAMTSAFPFLANFVIIVNLLFLVGIMVMNLRGTKESANAFVWPTYLFIGLMLLLGLVGIIHPLGPIPHAIHSIVTLSLPTLGVILLMKAFSSGATALTGIEAISNSVPAFKVPETKNASKVMVQMGLSITVLFSLTSYLAYKFHTVASANQTTLSQIAHFVFGNDLFYYALQFSTTVVLILAANTAYNGFPNMMSLLARDNYLARYMGARGDKLVYTNGIMLLTFVSGTLIFLYKGNTNDLLPLYAIGVFASFTIAQLGVIKKSLPKRDYLTITVNAVGAILTAGVFVIMLISKFTSGAWAVVIAVPLMVYGFNKIKGHYVSLARVMKVTDAELASSAPEPFQTTVILPIASLNKMSLRSLAYARGLSSRPIVIFVAFSEEEEQHLQGRWELLGIPAEEVRFEIIRSRYRSVTKTLSRFIRAELELHGGKVTVILPELVTPKWWQALLHNKTAWLLEYYMGTKDMAIIKMPYHVENV